MNSQFLRHLPERAEYLAHNSKNNLSNNQNKFNYEKVLINQYMNKGFYLAFKIIIQSKHHNFHNTFGGLKKYLFKRLFYGVWYRKNIKNFWFPVELDVFI